VELARAALRDIPACAELYQNAFPEIITILFDQPHIDINIVKDILSVIREYEPEGFYISSENKQIVGFIMVISDINKFSRHIVTRGYPIRFLFRWVAGKYHGLRLVFLKRLWKIYRDYRHSEVPPPALPMGQVLSIVVDKSRQGQGIGSALFEKAIDYLKTTSCRVIRLEVDAENENAIRMYRKFGFDEQTRFISPRGEALAMIKILKGESDVHI
jgi:ribosomal protein S18 acetylase RimI-like enzyme